MDDKKALNEYFVFVKEYLQNINDIELLILKGHNLVEHSINRYIQDVVQRPDEYYKLNLTFAEKVGIMKFMTSIHLTIFEHLTLLNKVRNELSHNLHPNKKNVDAFLLQMSYADKMVKQSLDVDKILAMKYAIRNICVQLNFGRIGVKYLNAVLAQQKLEGLVK